MSWTDARVKTLKDMWTQGKSASEIAEKLGGVTRNAVIGKAHRLGLSGRPSPIKGQKATASPKTKKQPTKPKASGKTLAEKPEKTRKAQAKVKPEKLSKKPEIKNGVHLKPADPEKDLERLKKGELIGILDLTERTCRWPVGDPKQGAFGFCGCPAEPGKPYCDAHMLLAFQTAASRKETRRAQDALVKEKQKKILDDARRQREAEEIDEEEIDDIDLDDLDPDALDSGDLEDMDDLEDDI